MKNNGLLSNLQANEFYVQGITNKDTNRNETQL